jgi:hypothetical protein
MFANQRADTQETRDPSAIADHLGSELASAEGLQKVSADTDDFHREPSDVAAVNCLGKRIGTPKTR